MAEVSYRLQVMVDRAEGLQHMNHFTGDHPYVVCEVKHSDTKAGKTAAETNPVIEGDTLNPVWNEVLELQPWQPGEVLEFTVYDKGLMGSKTEGKVMLPSEVFFPQSFRGTVGIIGLQGAKLRVEVQAVGVAEDGSHVSAPTARSVAYRTPMVYLPAPGSGQTPAPAESTPGLATEELKASNEDAQQPDVIVAPTEVKSAEAAGGPLRLAVSILQAHGLKHLNDYAGDQPCVTCEVKHFDSSAKETKVVTKTVTEGDTLNPFWGETLHLEPWLEGESLEFTVSDQGLTSSKTEGKVVLTPEVFFPNGFSGTLMVSGLPDALLDVIVRPLGLAASANPESKESNKLNIGKKNKRCC